MDPKDIVIERVKEFSPEVAHAINKFVSQLGNNNLPFTDDSLREILASPQSYLFIARQINTNEIAGMVMEIVYRTTYTKKAYAEELFIDEKFRKIGIGTKLMQEILKTAKEQHAVYIDFTSRP